MMRFSVVLLLLKTHLKGSKPIASLIQRFSFGKRKSVRTISAILLALATLFSLGVFILLLGGNYYSYQLVGEMVGIPHVGLLLAVVLATGTLLLFSAPGAINILHSATEIERLRSLAIQDSELATARLLIFYLFFFPIYLFFMLPALVVGAITSGVSFFYVISSILLLIFGPVIPLSIAALLEIAIVRLTKGRRSQRTGDVFYLIVMMAFIIGLMSQLGKTADNFGNFQGLTHQLAPTITKLTRIFAPFTLQTHGLYNPLLLLVWLAIAVILGYITVVVAGITFASSCSLLASSGYPGRRRKRNHSGGGTPLRALMKREWAIISETSGFLFEVGGELLIPLILIITYTAMGIMGDISSATKALAAFPFFESVVVLVLLMFSNMSLLSATSVSRQGKLATLDRLYPLPPSTFVQAKLYLHLFLVGTAHTLYLIVATLLFKLTLSSLVIYLVLSFIVITSTSYFHLAIDYHNPLLEWTTTQQAMKRNPNGFLGILVSFLSIVWVGLFLVLIPYVLKLNQSLTHIITLISAVGTAKVAQRLAYRSAERFLTEQ
ncbi:MAG: hypothetical protein WCY61_01085 [Sphaerochaeta sp.]